MDFSGNVDVNDDLPTEQDLKRVGDLLVLDSQGVSTPFKEVFGGHGKAKRQLVIFVRHFFCGVSILPSFIFGTKSRMTNALTSSY